MSDRRARVLTAPLALAATLLVAVGVGTASPSDLSGVQYFRLDPGTPTETGTMFDIPVFVLGQPAGGPANLSETTQAWQDLQVQFLNATPAPFTAWSVREWGAGRFDLDLALTSAQAGAVEDGQALLTLNSSVVVDGTVLGASGQVDGAVLSSAIVIGAWWSNVFGIPTPPPDPSLSSLHGIVDDLAWFGDSTAGRAAYAATTLVAILLYLWEGHKLARAKLLGRPSHSRQEVPWRRRGPTSCSSSPSWPPSASSSPSRPR
jgi:hypothetical protein